MWMMTAALWLAGPALAEPAENAAEPSEASAPVVEPVRDNTYRIDCGGWPGDPVTRTFAALPKPIPPAHRVPRTATVGEQLALVGPSDAVISADGVRWWTSSEVSTDRPVRAASPRPAAGRW